MNAQEVAETDSITHVDVYGLRVGVDISKPITSFINEDYKGLEIALDYRVNKSLFVATEFGTTTNTTTEDYLNFSTDGSYIKLGVNYNVYENWAGMNNQIFFGARYALSFFNQTLNSYTPNIYGEYIIPEEKIPGTEFNDLKAQWIEIVTGLKVETFKNLYLGFAFSFNFLRDSKEPENFKNLYIPGFNKVFYNDLGFGFTYTVAYLIPFKKVIK